MRTRRPLPMALAVVAVIAACERQQTPLDPTLSVVAVTITPPADTIQLGDSVQLAATVVMSGNQRARAASWASADGAVASVDQAGLVRGLSAGLARIVASSANKADTALVAVLAAAPPPPPPGGGVWPNEPAGFTLVTDEPFNALTENGWNSVQRQGTNGSGLFLGLDAAAPKSPVSVLQFTYAAGYTAGSEPGVAFYDPAAPIKETYFAFWWKPSSPWQNNSGSGVNKMAFLFPSASGDIYLMMYGGGSGYTVAVEPEFSGDTRLLTPNVTATPVSLGAWHLIEWYVKYATSGTSRDGVTSWWLDGVLQGSYSDLQTPADAGFIEYQLAPTWGGVDGTKTETDFYWFDHARISRR